MLVVGVCGCEYRDDMGFVAVALNVAVALWALCAGVNVSMGCRVDGGVGVSVSMGLVRLGIGMGVGMGMSMGMAMGVRMGMDVAVWVGIGIGVGCECGVWWQSTPASSNS